MAYPTTGLVARWLFDQDSGTTVVDAATATHTLTLSGSPVFDSSNPATGTGCLVFDGTDDYAATATTAALRPTTELSFSVWAWSADWETISGNKGILWHRYKNGTLYDGGYYLAVWSGVIRFFLRRDDAADATVSYSLENIDPGWHMFTCTFDGQYLKLYIDKALVGTTNLGTSGHVITYEGTGYHLSLGVTRTGTTVIDEGSYFNGRIDDSAVWNVALTESDIASVYAETWLSVGLLETATITPDPRYGQEYYPECFASFEFASAIISSLGRVIVESFELVNPITEEVGALSSSVSYEAVSDLLSNALTLATTQYLASVALDEATLSGVSFGERGLFETALASLEITPETTAQAVFVVLESISVVGSLVANGTYNHNLLATIGLRDRLFCTWLLSALEELEVAASMSEKKEVALALLEKINASASIGSEMLAVGIIAVALALEDTPLSGKGADVIDGTEIAESILTTALMYAAEIERAQFEATIASQGLLSFSTTDKIFVDANLFSSGIFKTAIEDGVSFAIDFGMGGQVYSAYVMNTKNFALSEYQNFPFNSLAKVGTQYYAASETGLYLLDGSTDAGEDVQATITLGAMDFTGERKTNVCEAFLALRNDGEIAIKVKTDDNIERWYRMSQESDVLRDRREKFARGVTSRFWTFSLENIDGADFEVHEMTFLPLVMKRRI